MTVIERPLFGKVELQRAELPTLLATGFETSQPQPFVLDANFSVETVTPRTGARRLRILAGATFRTASTALLDVIPGTQYTATVWARRDTAYNGTTANSKLSVRDSAAALITSVSFALSDLPNAAEWVQRQSTFTVPAGVTQIKFDLRGDHTAGYVVIDDVAVIGTAPVWYSRWIADALSLSIRRGGARTGLGIKTDAGLMTFELLDAEDPLLGGTIQPGQQLRAVSRDRAGALVELFTGRVIDVAAAYPLNKASGRLRTVTRVTVADAVKQHGETPRYGVSIAAGFHTFEARVAALVTSALAPVEAPVQGAPREVYAL